MSGSFDPYHKWLGISPKDQPPNHYRLLAIDLFESDPDVIASAADQRMTHVRSFQTGRRSALSQQVLNEIAAARVCLLNSEKKAEYDRQLRNQLDLESRRSEPAEVPLEAPPQPPVLPPLPPAAPPLDEGVAPRFEGSFPRQWLRRRKLPWRALTAVLVSAVSILVALIVLMTSGGSPPLADTEEQPPPTNRPGPPEPPSPLPEAGESPGPDDPPDENAEDPTANEGAVSEPPKKTEPKTPTVPVLSPNGKPTVAEPPDTEPARVPVPDAAAQASAEARLQGTLANASAAQLLEAAGAAERPADERFVLLERARDLAAGSEDVETALSATDEIIRRYEVDALEAKVETIDTLRASVTTALAARALAENGLALADQALAEGRKDLAVKLVEHTMAVALKHDDREMHKQAVMRFVKMQSSP
ncbi:MAG: hypothetical protein ACYTG0_35055 [Planctomycetota bacterium]|jgi:hypothetical protein